MSQNPTQTQASNASCDTRAAVRFNSSGTHRPISSRFRFRSELTLTETEVFIAALYLSANASCSFKRVFVRIVDVQEKNLVCDKVIQRQ
uniref:Cyclin N-terminal domain-containing protein n=1 Tax=Syphacia muris TaxID=451379 RepID=A0A0N5AKP6_9BILA